MSRFKTIVRSTQKLISDHSPVILTGVAVAGVASTAIFAAKGGARSNEELKKAAEESDHDLLPKEKVEIAWKFYIPAATMGGATIACIIGANTISTKRNAALMSVYSLTETAFKEYQDKVAETIGRNKEENVRADIVKDHIAAEPVENKQVIVTNTGEHLCYETLTGRYFQSSIEQIRRAQNDINAKIINEMYASQNDFHNLIGLPSTSYGEEVGWRAENLLDIKFSSVLTEDDKPCLAVEYRVQPIRDYFKLW